MIPGLIGLVGWPLFLLIPAGLIDRNRMWVCFLTPLLFLPLFSFAMSQRYWLPYLPFLLLAAGLGLVWLKQRWPWAGSGRALVIGSLVVLLGLGIAIQDDAYLYKKVDEVHPLLRQAGFWLRSQVDRDTKIASYKPQPSYWAWARFEKCPEGENLLETLDQLKASGVQYLVVDVYTSLVWRQQLLPLVKNPERPLSTELEDRVRLVLLLTNDADYRMNTCVYQLL